MIVKTCIIIPCYNEGERLSLLVDDYTNFVRKYTDVLLCFVNDGSSDNTEEVILGIKNNFPEQIIIVSYYNNVGKAEAVREGIVFCNNKYNHEYIAYLDADLSTTLQECESLTSYINDNIHFVFGSRMAKIGSEIKRKKHRFLIGRIIATFISRVLDIKVYDTQCGCKIFTKELSILLFEERFISKWLFDVELFFRMIHIYGKEKAVKKMDEVPLKLWVDKDDSKVKFNYFFKLWVDLYKIKKRYSN